MAVYSNVGFGLLLPLALLSAPLAAQPAAPAAEKPDKPQCPRDAESIPVALAGWSSRMALATAAEGEGPAIVIGKGYDLKLMRDAKLRMPNLPGPVKDRVGFGGIVNLAVATPGVYRVALGAGGWVDLVRDGKALISIAHGHGPACSGIGKMVDFRLKPGVYRLTIDGNETDHLSVLVAALP